MENERFEQKKKISNTVVKELSAFSVTIFVKFTFLLWNLHIFLFEILMELKYNIYSFLIYYVSDY